ncbi:MAG: hypothetical protein RSE17_00930, partial [Bacilli bacterium]
MDKTFWKTVRGKAVIKLIVWSIFFLLLFIVLSFMGSKGKNDDKNNLVIGYNEKIDRLLKNNYEYEYKITINGNNINFNGKKDGKNEQGYKETKEGIIKYLVMDSVIYNITANKKEPINNLYENINTEYLNFSVLFKNLFSIKYEITAEEENNKLTYEYNYNNNVIKVISNKKDITDISIISSDSTSIYIIHFTNIGKVGT